MATAHRTPAAEEDLFEIWAYIFKHDPAAADRVLDQLDDVFGMLAQNPFVGPKREDLGGEVRFFPVGNHLVFYRPKEDGITVVRVLHGARDYEGEFR